MKLGWRKDGASLGGAHIRCGGVCGSVQVFPVCIQLRRLLGSEWAVC